MTCLKSAASQENGFVYYFDSGASFSAGRLSDLWDNSLAFASHRTAMSKSSVLQRIIKVGVFDVDQLQIALKMNLSQVLMKL